MNFTIYDFIGSIGVAIVIFTYFLLQIGKLRSDGLWYSLLNSIGAAFITLSLIFSFNLAAFVVEVLWVFISLFGVGRYFYTRNR
jgi:hypothetical protein